MSKRRSVLIILGVIVLGAVCFAMLVRQNEPKYNGRYLSEWMMSFSVVQAEECKRAIRAIGTNALPCYLKWIRYEPVDWRTSLYEKLPSWMQAKPKVVRWARFPAWRGDFGVFGIRLLGTNAATAIPKLTMIMRDGTKPSAARNAIDALAGIGEPAIPVLKAALADTNQVNRWRIVQSFGMLFVNGHSNEGLPILIESLNDPDAEVREQVTRLIGSIAPEVLTNAPAQQGPQNGQQFNEQPTRAN